MRHVLVALALTLSSAALAQPPLRATRAPQVALLQDRATPVALRASGPDEATALLVLPDGAWRVLVITGARIKGPLTVFFPSAAKVSRVVLDSDGAVWGVGEQATEAWRWTVEGVEPVPLVGCEAGCRVAALTSGLTPGPDGTGPVRLGLDVVAHVDGRGPGGAPVLTRDADGAWTVPGRVTAADLGGCVDDPSPLGAVVADGRLVTVTHCGELPVVRWHGGGAAAAWSPAADERVLVRVSPDGRVLAMTVGRDRVDVDDLGGAAPPPVAITQRWMPAGPPLDWPEVVGVQVDGGAVSRLSLPIGPDTQVVDAVVTGQRVVLLGTASTVKGPRVTVMHTERMPVLAAADE